MKSQKIRRKRFRKTQAGRPRMHDLLAQPSAAFYRLPEYFSTGWVFDHGWVPKGIGFSAG